MTLQADPEIFLDVLRKRMIDPGGELVEGKVTRATCSCKPSKKGRDGNAWYLFYSDEPATLTWGCWNTGCPNAKGGRHTAKSEKTLTPVERETIKIRIEAERQAREEERQRVEQTTREKTARLWESTHDVSADHPYIVNGGNFRPVGAKQVKDMLAIPMSATGIGDPESLQLIFPDGTKRFLTGTGAIPGPLYHAIKGNGGPLYIAEGWKTGCSIHEASGASVVIAFSSGRLPAVAEVLKGRFPGREIVIAGDKGNGSSKAIEAARLIGCKVVIPTMPDGVEGTDFNDLHNAAGLEEVARQLAMAKEPIPEPTPADENASEDKFESLDEAVTRLAALSPLQYDQVRKESAKILGVRPATLDAAVRDARKGGIADDLPFQMVELWPEPVDPAELLAEIADTVRRFIVCEKETVYTVALWVAMTWFIDVVQVAPLAVITAPEKRCGKTMLLTLLGRLCAKSITASSISPSALFRAIDAWCPTLMIDECDALLKDNEELRGLLNSGHTRDSAYVIRTVGESFTPTKFNTWGAKALSGIGHVADTLMDRAVILELRRKLPNEEVDRIRYAEPNLFTNLQSKLARFAEDYREQVRQARPPLPHSLNDRAQDNWEPLLAIAMVAGDEWLQIGTATALKLSGSESSSQTIGTELLSDIREIFESKGVDRISTAELIKALCADDEKPWATYNRGLQIKPRQLSAKLKGYDIRSKNIRIGYGEVPKGYERNQFNEAFSRYLPHNDVAQKSLHSGSDSKNATPNTPKSLTCSGVADRGGVTDSEKIPNFDF